MVKIKGKIIRIGGSYGFIIPKALIEAEVLKKGEEYKLQLIDDDGLVVKCPSIDYSSKFLKMALEPVQMVG